MAASTSFPAGSGLSVSRTTATSEHCPRTKRCPASPPSQLGQRTHLRRSGGHTRTVCPEHGSLAPPLRLGGGRTEERVRTPRPRARSTHIVEGGRVGSASDNARKCHHARGTILTRSRGMGGGAEPAYYVPNAGPNPERCSRARPNGCALLQRRSNSEHRLARTSERPDPHRVGHVLRPMCLCHEPARQGRLKQGRVSQSYDQ